MTSPAVADLLGLAAAPRKAAPVVLDARMDAGTAFAVVTRECADHFRTNERMLLTSRAAPHLHQTRVGIRRLRSAFSLFGPLVGAVPTARLLAHRLRGLALPFGPARDLDVLLSGPLVEGLDDDQRSRLLEHREGAYDAVLAILHSPEWSAVGHDLDELLAGTPTWPDAGGLTGLARDALEKRSRRVTRHADDLAAMSPADRHAVRIEAKKLRYGCEFFAALFPADRPTVTDGDGRVLTGPLAHAWMVEEVQSALGALNDHATADALLHRVGARAPEVDEAALLADAETALRRLSAGPPPWR